MKNKIAVSVIIPVYNVQEYIGECLESLVNQSIGNIEIIAVNDGSTDSSGEILNEYKRRYPDKIIVIHKQNSGPGDSRNQGIKVAKGEYIGFVDSDDWVEPSMFEDLYAEAKMGYDVVVCDTLRIKGKNDVTPTIVKIYEGKMPKTKRELMKKVYMSASPCNKIYKTKIIQDNGIEYPNCWYEDFGFVPVAMSYAERVGYIDKAYYNYRIVDESVTMTEGSHKILDIIEAFKYAKSNINPEYKEEFIYSLVTTVIRYSQWKKTFEAEFIEYIKELEVDIYRNKALIKEIGGSKIFEYLTAYLMPKILHLCLIGKSELTEVEQNCIDALKCNAIGYKLMIWDEKNCNIKENQTVYNAYQRGNYNFVNDYYKLRAIYNFGGISLDPDILLKPGFSRLIINKLFFGFESKENIHTKVLGSMPEHHIIGEILETYNSEKEIFKDKFISATERIKFILSKKYNLKLTGFRQMIYNNEVQVYSPAYLLFDINDGYNYSERMYDGVNDRSLEKNEGLQLYIESLKFYQSRNYHLQQRVNKLEGEVRMYSCSKSWKITKPLRKLGDLYREIKGRN